MTVGKKNNDVSMSSFQNCYINYIMFLTIDVGTHFCPTWTTGSNMSKLCCHLCLFSVLQ